MSLKKLLIISILLFSQNILSLTIRNNSNVPIKITNLSLRFGRHSYGLGVWHMRDLGASAEGKSDNVMNIDLKKLIAETMKNDNIKEHSDLGVPHLRIIQEDPIRRTFILSRDIIFDQNTDTIEINNTKEKIGFEVITSTTLHPGHD